jgi:hypothetical protein
MSGTVFAVGGDSLIGGSGGPTVAELRFYAAWAAVLTFVFFACVVRWFAGPRLRRAWLAVALIAAAAVAAGTAYLSATYDHGMLAGLGTELICMAATVALPPVLGLMYLIKRLRSRRSADTPV